MDEELLTSLLILMIAILILGGLAGIYVYNKNTALSTITKIGYDAKDVEIFCRYIGISLEDFIDSEGIKKQYELFRQGYITEYMRQARENKMKEGGKTTGIAIGVGVGYLLGSGGRKLKE